MNIFTKYSEMLPYAETEKASISKLDELMESWEKKSAKIRRQPSLWWMAPTRITSSKIHEYSSLGAKHTGSGIMNLVQRHPIWLSITKITLKGGLMVSVL